MSASDTSENEWMLKSSRRLASVGFREGVTRSRIQFPYGLGHSKRRKTVSRATFLIAVLSLCGASGGIRAAEPEVHSTTKLVAVNDISPIRLYLDRTLSLCSVAVESESSGRETELGLTDFERDATPVAIVCGSWMYAGCCLANVLRESRTCRLGGDSWTEYRCLSTRCYL